MPKWLWWAIGFVIFYNVFIKEEPKPQIKYYPVTVPIYPAEQTFSGYKCTVDCSGHAAGYQWAEEHDIDDEDDCGGNSQSFIEGCKAYVQENQ